MNKQLKFKGIFLAILSAVLFGLSPLFSIMVYDVGGTPLAVTFFRLVFSTLAMAILHKATSKVPLLPSKTEAIKLFLAAVPYGLTPALLFSSYNYLSSGLCTTLHFVYPVVVLIGSVIFLHQKITLQKIICCILCGAGIICFYTPGGNVSVFGIFLAAISGVVYSAYIIYLSGSGLQEMPPFKLCCWLCFFGMIVVGIPAVVSGQMVYQYSLPIWAVIAIFALFGGCGATTCFQLGAKYVGPQSASLLSTFEPLTSIVVGVLVYHEILTVRSVIGIICILVSVVLMSIWNDE